MSAGDYKATSDGNVVVFNVDSTITRDIERNDVLVLSNDLEASLSSTAELTILGVAAHHAPAGGLVDVVVEGKMTVKYTGSDIPLTGESNSISTSSELGIAQKDEFGAGKGMAIDVDTVNKLVTIIL